MARMQARGIIVIAALVVGCQSDMDRIDRAEAETHVAGPTGQPSNTAVVAQPVPASPAPSALPSAPADRSSTGLSGYTEKVGQEGLVDWSAGVVTATGIGYPPADTINSTQAYSLAKRAALAVAYRNLLEAIKAIRVDSTTTVKNYVATNDEVQTRISGMVEHAEIIEEGKLEGGYKVVVKMKLTGEISRLCAPKDAPAPRRIPQPDTPSLPRPTKTPYTGLAIDARGTDLHPALVPRILTEDGLEAYSQSYVLAKYRQKDGIVAYVSDPAAAQSHPKVTDHPLTVKALRTAGNSHTDLVISNATAQTIHGGHFDFLEKGQVIVIIDPSGHDSIMR